MLTLHHYNPQTATALIAERSQPHWLFPPYTSRSRWPINKTSVHDDIQGEFESWEVLHDFLRLHNAQITASMVYSILTRIHQSPDELRSAEDVHRFLRKYTEQHLKKREISAALPQTIRVLRVIYAEPSVSRESLIRNHDWLLKHSTNNANQIIIQSGHEPFSFRNWLSLSILDIENGWIKEQEFESVIHWAMFMIMYCPDKFDESLLSNIKRIYEIASKEHARQQYEEAGGFKRLPWQRKIKTRR